MLSKIPREELVRDIVTAFTLGAGARLSSESELSVHSNMIRDRKINEYRS